MKNIIVITGASSGFGSLTSHALARAGHAVYAGMRETRGRNAPQVEEADRFSKEHGVDLRPVEMDVSNQPYVGAAIKAIIEQQWPYRRADPQCWAHGLRAGGSLHSRATRRALRHQCAEYTASESRGAAVSAETAEGARPLGIEQQQCGRHAYLPGTYFASKAGMDAMAVVYAHELVRWGVETTIVVLGAFTGGTNHFAHSGRPADTAVVAEYEAGPYKAFADDVMKGFASIVPPDADASAVAEAIVKIVDTPFGKRPFRVHVNPTEDGAEVTNMVMDRFVPNCSAVSAWVICCKSRSKSRRDKWVHG
jgi:NAD(P)-dependent dehydrogenase (short-subunit alcohol dehydrogenase family)